MAPSRRRFMELGTIASLGGFATSAQGDASVRDVVRDEPEAHLNAQQASGTEVTVRQEPGEAFYWVLPGERRLSPQVFGTPEHPRFGSDHLRARIEQAKELPSPLCNAIPQLLQDLPFLVAAPEEAREPVDDGIVHEKLTTPTLYSNEAQVTSGELELTYVDRQPYDIPGPPGETEDTVELETQFTDPAGNEYELDLDHVVQPPIPGYETGGGVLTHATHHGMTGTGSPLMAKVFNYGASWGVGDVIINGEVATTEGFRVIHMMTTQTVRDARYRLAIDEELPLAPENTIAGQLHHTHGVVLPIRPTPDGPVFDPVPTAFELPNGETQPFIHAMWEQETIENDPFGDWEFPGAGDAEQDAEEDQEEDQSDVDFKFAGRAGGWEGQLPDEIGGETNPTLALEEGVEYTLVWENADGLQHNFAIEDGDGTDLLSTELMGEEGTTQSVTFTASAEMSEYYCQVHPESMRGPVEVQN